MRPHFLNTLLGDERGHDRVAFCGTCSFRRRPCPQVPVVVLCTSAESARVHSAHTSTLEPMSLRTVDQLKLDGARVRVRVQRLGWVDREVDPPRSAR